MVFGFRGYNHVSRDLQKLNVADEYKGDDKLQVGNINQLCISHVGSSSLLNLHLPNMLIVPKLTKNLLSVSKLTDDNNVYVELWSKHCNIKNLQGQTLLRGDFSDGLYWLSHNQINCSKHPHVVFMGVKSSLQGWNGWLDHPNEPILRCLVSSFNLPLSSNKLPSVCDSCQMGKCHRFHLFSSHVASTKPFGLVYSDVWGPPLFFHRIETNISFS